MADDTERPIAGCPTLGCTAGRQIGQQTGPIGQPPGCLRGVGRWRTLTPRGAAQERAMSEPHRRRVEHAYPHPITLANQASVTVRLMTASDADRLLRFARLLPEQDLLF